jgi:hypothetical protein
LVKPSCFIDEDINTTISITLASDKRHLEYTQPEKKGKKQRLRHLIKLVSAAAHKPAP